MIKLGDGREFYASPGDDTKTAYFNWLLSAKQSILIADYSFNLLDFTVDLPKLVASGVTVRLVLDKSQSAGSTEKPIIAALKAAKIDLVIGTSSVSHQIMHDKFTVLDGISSQYGSWNYTNSASKEDNFFFIDPSIEVATALTNTWTAMHDWIVANEPQTAQALGLMAEEVPEDAEIES